MFTPQKIRALALTLINAFPLEPFRNIYRTEWSFILHVKKMALFERSEFDIFRVK